MEINIVVEIILINISFHYKTSKNVVFAVNVNYITLFIFAKDDTNVSALNLNINYIC